MNIDLQSLQAVILGVGMPLAVVVGSALGSYARKRWGQERKEGYFDRKYREHQASRKIKYPGEGQ